MVEFRFDIKPLFPQPIVKITSNLLPHTFRGDRRMALDTTSKMSEIIDTLGELSATSQKLSKAVTSAQRLRISDNQRIYLLADAEAGHNGAVIGLLKVGTKSLYLFDESGETKKVDDTPCILDFYIHESRQRAGLGKDLFETMLSEENWSPIKLSIDRPSEKLLGFLKKHYGMEKTIPQSNNFVLYEGFFGPPSTENSNQQHPNSLHITDSPNTALFGPHFIGNDNKKRIRQQDCPSPTTQITQISPVGRYAAPRPTCSMAEVLRKYIFAQMDRNTSHSARSTRISNNFKVMKSESEISLTHRQALKYEKCNSLPKNPLDAITRPPKMKQSEEKRSGLQNVSEDNFKMDYSSFSQRHSIIHSSTKPSTGEASSKLSDAGEAVKGDVAIDFICKDLQALHTSPSEKVTGHEIGPDDIGETKLESHDENINNISENLTDDEPKVVADSVAENHSQLKKPTSFQLSKQHTGLKNISFNVGMAVTPTNKMEFDQEQTDEFGVVKINRPPGKLVSPPPPDNTDAMSTVSAGEGFTDQGYYDLKFYHNKLW